MQQALIDLQVDEHMEYVDIFNSMGEAASRETLIGGLRAATRNGIITAAGVRPLIGETALHYRYVIDDGDEGLVVRIEEDDGEVLSSHTWKVGRPPGDFYQELVEAVRMPGTTWALL